MPTSVFDAIVVGTGGIGSAVLAELAGRGARVLGIDRFPPGHDRGSSHGQTRIIRQAYFEHPDYVPLLLRAYELWTDLERRTGEKLFHQVGLLQIGPASGVVVAGVLASAQQHGLDVERLTPDEVNQRYPGLRAHSWTAAVFERCAGYLRVEACVKALAQSALDRGAKIRVGETVRTWRADAHQVEVETEAGTYQARSLVITTGAWANQLLADLRLPLEVRRKPQYWYSTTTDDYLPERGFPTFLFETPTGMFYGFPQLGLEGIKVAEHTGGRLVTDPSLLDRDIDREDQIRVESFVGEYLPSVKLECSRHAACMYTLTPDHHFVVDRHPEHERVAFAAGLSGHGFKFAPVLGEVLADLALGGRTSLPVGFLTQFRPALNLGLPG